MTDEKLQQELNKLAKYNLKYKSQLVKVENECKKRFGYVPAEVDCDYFIDTFCVGTGGMTVEELNTQMGIAVDGRSSSNHIN